MIYQRIQNYYLSVHFALLLMLMSLIGIILIMINTSPIELGPSLMLLAFGVFYIWFFSLFLSAIHIWRIIRKKQEESEKTSKISVRSLGFAAAWAFAPLIMLALQSIGQLEVVSLGLVLLFEILISIFILKR